MNISGINPQPNARTIFDKLDSLDGKDGEVTSSIWNKFAKICNMQTIADEETKTYNKDVENAINSCFEKGVGLFIKLVNFLSVEEANMNASKQNIKKSIENEVKAYGKDLSKVDTEYWTELIYKISHKYNIPEEIVVAIMAKESDGKFDNSKKICKNGCGPLQMTTAGINAFNPNAEGNWYDDIYVKMDPVLTADTVGSRENPRFKSSSECRIECGSNDEFGTMAGVLKFKGCYVDAVGMVVYGCDRVTYGNTKKALKGLQDGSIKLTASQKRNCMRLAFKLYNGSPNKNTYANSAMESLNRMNYDFNTVIIN